MKKQKAFSFAYLHGAHDTFIIGIQFLQLSLILKVHNRNGLCSSSSKEVFPLILTCATPSKAKDCFQQNPFRRRGYVPKNEFGIIQ
jgi:hypothetical protein